MWTKLTGWGKEKGALKKQCTENELQWFVYIKPKVLTFIYNFCMPSKEQNIISYYLYNCTIVGKSSYIREGFAKPQSKLLYNLCTTLSYFILVQKCSNSCHNFNITNQGRSAHCTDLFTAFIYWNYSTY